MEAYWFKTAQSDSRFIGRNPMFIDYVTANADMSQVQHAMYLTAYNKIVHA